jgi:hypothetical protein
MFNNNFTLESKRKIIDRINKLNNINNFNFQNNNCFKKIFKIICHKHFNYIINSSGIIFNILDIDNDTLYIIDNILKKYEDKIEELKSDFDNKVNENKKLKFNISI